MKRSISLAAIAVALVLPALLSGCASMTPEQRQQFVQGIVQYQQTHPIQPIPIPQTSHTNTQCTQYVPGQVQCQSTTTGY